MKAHEVMRILKIARPTLSKYVKEKKINVSVIKHNNRYMYDPRSVFKLASNDTRTNSDICMLYGLLKNCNK